MRRVHSATDAGIMSGIGICQRMMPLRIIDCEATLDVLFGGVVVSHPGPRCPKAMMRLDQQAFIAFGLCKFQALLAPLVGSAQVSSDRIVRCFADERDEQLVLVAELFAESPCSRKCLQDLGRAEIPLWPSRPGLERSGAGVPVPDAPQSPAARQSARSPWSGEQ